MTKPESLSKRAELRFWGWGYADEHLSLEEDQLVEAMVAVMAPNSTEVASPSIDDFDLPSMLFLLQLLLHGISLFC